MEADVFHEGAVVEYEWGEPVAEGTAQAAVFGAEGGEEVSVGLSVLMSFELGVVDSGALIDSCK